MNKEQKNIKIDTKVQKKGNIRKWESVYCKIEQIYAETKWESEFEKHTIIIQSNRNESKRGDKDDELRYISEFFNI